MINRALYKKFAFEKYHTIDLEEQTMNRWIVQENIRGNTKMGSLYHILGPIQVIIH